MSVCTVDVGSTFIKVAVYDAELRLLASARADFPAVREGGCAEADPDAMWRAFAGAVREAATAARVVVSTLVLSAQMAGLALLDHDGRPLGPVILSVDRRGEPVEPDPRTGCPPGAIYPAGKLAWLVRHDPARLAAARFVGGVKEYLLHRLARVWVTDPSSASTTGLYDVTAGRWFTDPPYAEPTQLPQVVPPHSRVGEVSPAAAGECGLAAGTAVFAGVGDGPAANLASGAVGGARLCLSVGTTLVARLLVRGRALPESDLPYFVQHVDSDWYCLGMRLDPDGDGYSPVGAPGTRRPAAEVPQLLRPLLAAYGVTELRPVGSRCRDRDLLRRLATDWALPVRATDAYDGTRGAALLALVGGDGDWPGMAARAPVTADVTPEGVAG
jgi:sugar (pentulose or hexulose) kinase